MSATTATLLNSNVEESLCNVGSRQWFLKWINKLFIKRKCQGRKGMR